MSSAKIEKALASLQDNGVHSVVMLRTLVGLKEPRTAGEIETSTGLNRTAMRRFALRHPDLVKKVRTDGQLKAGQGRPVSVAYLLTARGRRLIDVVLGL